MVDYLRKENRVLRARLRGKRLRLAVVPTWRGSLLRLFSNIRPIVWTPGLTVGGRGDPYLFERG